MVADRVLPASCPRPARAVFHIDFDCFFVAAGLTTRPELKGKPVAVCHGGQGEGVASTSEIATCSYEARDKGVKSGISYFIPWSMTQIASD